MPGGQRVTVKDGSNSGEGAFTGTFHSSHHGDGLVTAGHVLDSEDLPVYKKIGSNKSDIQAVGVSKDVNVGNRIDCGFVTTDQQSAFNGISSADNSFIEYEITGIISDQELKNNVSNSSLDLYKQGRATGRQSVSIDRLEPSSTSIKSVVVDKGVNDGDSGGPVFADVDGLGQNAHIAGTIFADVGSFWDPETEATTAETIEQTLGGYFY